MTYKEIVDRFREVVRDHNQLQDFGYGNLSDIKTRSEGGTTTNTDYPYLFLNQGTHSRSQQAISYNFNMIVMDVVKDDDFLKIQSECQQYIDDVLARLRFHYTDQVDLNLSNITLTPFKERFQDTVAGMTASITIEIPQRLNECIAPFEPIIPEPTPIYSAELSYPDYSGGFIQRIGVALPFLVDAQIIDTDYVTETNYIEIEPVQDINATVSVDITLENLIDQSVIDEQPGDVWTDITGALYLHYYVTENFQQIPVPVQAVNLDFSKAIGEEYTISAEFPVNLAAGTQYKFSWLGEPFTAALENIALWKDFKYQVFLNSTPVPVPNPLDVQVRTFDATNAECDNGLAELRVDAGSGVAPYTAQVGDSTDNFSGPFIWQPGNLSAGTYPWSVTDSEGTISSGTLTIGCTA